MSLKTFDWPFHELTLSYPQRGSQVKLGGNWTYATKSSSPVMRNLQLNFRLLKWVRDASGILVSTLDRELNLLRLDEFYQEHEQHKDFIYPHEIYGNMIVKFAQPLVIPPAKLASDGCVMNMTINLVEQPT